MPKKTEEQQRKFVVFAQRCGFNTVITNPARAIIEEAHARSMLVCDILTPTVSRSFAQENQNCLQKLLPFEEGIAKLMNDPPYDNYNVYRMYAHQEYNAVEGGSYLCFEHPESIDELKRRIREKFEAFPVDGIALDFFGFQNHYACYCLLCREKRKAIKEGNPGLAEAGILQDFSENSILRISEILYAFVKENFPGALFLCHIYPVFNPNPFYGTRFKADFCGQTIAWFYKPFWDLDEVRRLAEYFKAHEEIRFNHFMPFVGCYGHGKTAYLKKSPAQLKEELLLAQKFGGGNMMFATLGVLHEHEDLFTVVSSLFTNR